MKHQGLFANLVFRVKSLSKWVLVSGTSYRAKVPEKFCWRQPSVLAKRHFQEQHGCAQDEKHCEVDQDKHYTAILQRQNWKLPEAVGTYKKKTSEISTKMIRIMGFKLFLNKKLLIQINPHFTFSVFCQSKMSRRVILKSIQKLQFPFEKFTVFCIAKQ